MVASTVPSSSCQPMLGTVRNSREREKEKPELYGLLTHSLGHTPAQIAS